MLGYLLVECDRVSEMWMSALLPLYGTSAVLDIYEVMTSKLTSKRTSGSLSTSADESEPSTSADENEAFWPSSRAYFLTRNTRIHDVSKLMLQASHINTSPHSASRTWVYEEVAGMCKGDVHIPIICPFRRLVCNT
jgi:hypothetical protein